MYPGLDFLRMLLCALLLAIAAGPAQAEPTAAAIEERVGTLRPGGFAWEPERAPSGAVEIVISLADQRAFVFRGGTLIGASTISSGKAGSESPIGRFEILEKKRHHRSNRYDDAPMPFMQRLNWHGVALHGGHVPGYAASHGCIRLPMGFAQRLFGVTERGGFVFVTEESLSSPRQALALARANADAPMFADRTPAGARGGAN